MRPRVEPTGVAAIALGTLLAESALLAAVARLDSLGGGNGHAAEVERDAQVGRYYLKLADRRVRLCLAALSDNDDGDTTKTADAVLGRG